MIKYEFMKLYKNRIFLFFGLILIVSNLIFLYLHEKDTTDFQYIYKQKSEYEAFRNGNEDVMQYSYYKSIEENENTYIESYPEFLSEMDDRAEGMKKLVIYSDTDSFVYRNIQKTCLDYQKLSGIEVTKGCDYGIKRLASYNWGILYVIIFLLITGYYLFFIERNKGLFLLIKTTKNGHFEIAKAKFFVYLTVIFLYTILQECSTIGFIGYLYGYGDVNRSIQSISEFRNCIYPLTIWGYMIVAMLSRILIAFVIASVIYLLSIAIKNEIFLLVISCSIIGLEMILNMDILETEKWSILKCVNIFYCWDGVQMWGEYLNLNIFQYPIRKEIVASILTGVVLVGSAIGGAVIFHKSYQVASDSVIEKFLLKLRTKTAFVWQYMRLGAFEFYKVFVQQKKGFIFFILIVLLWTEISGINDTNTYASAKEATYHSIINKMEGKFGEESLKVLEEEKQYIECIYQELQNQSNASKEDNEIWRIYWQSELDLKEEGVWMVAEQINQLYQKEGDVYQKYIVDEIDYDNLWNDFKTELLWWYIGVLGVILWSSGIYPIEEKKRMYPLIRTTKKGRTTLNRRKNSCILAGTIGIFGFMAVFDFIRYYSIDGFRCIQHKLSDFTMMNIEKNWTLGTLLLVIFILKAVAYFIPMLLCITISRLLKSEMLTSIVMCGSMTVVFIILYYFEIDITKFILSMVA